MTETSIIIVTYGQWSATERCLRSLDAAIGEELGKGWEVVVVDNNSPDETPARLAEWSDRIRVDLQPANLNFAGGCNRGVALSGGDSLIFLNNDTEVPPGALQTLAEQLSEPGVGAAGCRLLFPNGTIQHAGVAFIAGFALGGVPMPQHILHHQDGALSASFGVYDVDCVTAACVAVRREQFLAVGGFDEEYRNGLEDVDLCLKLRSAGQRIVYRGDLTVVHHEGGSRGAGAALWATPEKGAAMAHNDLTFVRRWAAKLEGDTELANRVWDGELRDGRVATTDPRAGASVVIGQPSGVGAGADEARAMVMALTHVGADPCAIDLPNPNLVARLDEPDRSALAAALRRGPRDDPRIFYVPAGPADELYHPAGMLVPEQGSVVRLGWPRTALALEQVATVLAPSRATVAQLVQAGIDAAQVTWMPPLIRELPLGAGGGGVVLLLPADDWSRTVSLLSVAAELSARWQVSMLPAVFSSRLTAAAGSIAPQASLLAPCSAESRYAETVSTADLVLSADLLDPYDRRALVAAAVGTNVLTTNAAGPVGDVLGAGHLAGRAPLIAEVTRALKTPTDRAELQATIRRTCALSLIADHLDLPAGSSRPGHGS